MATSNIKSYGIFANKVVDHQLVNNLLFKCNYIYIQKVCGIFVITLTVTQYDQGHDYNKSKPYEHPIIVDVIHAVFFLPLNTITAQYPDWFKLDDPKTLKLTPSMVALAAVVVCCITNLSMVSLLTNILGTSWP